MTRGNDVSTVPQLRRLFTRRVDADVLVVGGGSAGLLAAIAAAESGASVALVDKGKVGRSGCSVFAAGILTFPLPGEDTEVWMDEMIRLGEFLNDQMWVRTLIDRCHDVVLAIDKWGTEYGKVVLERNADRSPVRRKSRGHIKTAHCVFNAIPLMDTLRRRARQVGVQLVERTMVTDLLVDGGRIFGAVGFNYRSGERLLFGCRSAVASAGGGSFKSTFLGHRNLTGDLIAAAFRAGVVCRSFENLSTNTTARDFNTHGMNLYVGAGGRFVNGLGEEFMSKYDPTLGSRSTLPRLTQAFSHEAKEGRGPVYLDLSRVTPEDQELLRRILPESFKLWDRAGIDPFRDKIPWVPAWQGTLTYGGGIHVNERCETSLEGLYAAGDATPVPPFGGGSIGGICLPYAITSGQIAGESAGRRVAEKGPDLPQASALEELGREKMALALAPLSRAPGVTPDGVIRSLQEVLIPCPVSYIRSAETLEAALIELEGIWPAVDRVSARNLHDLVKANEVRNLALQGELILRSATLRTESRGTHYRIDFPYRDNENWLKWIFARSSNGAIELWTEDIPMPFLRPEEAREPHFLGV